MDVRMKNFFFEHSTTKKSSKEVFLLSFLIAWSFGVIRCIGWCFYVIKTYREQNDLVYIFVYNNLLIDCISYLTNTWMLERSNARMLEFSFFFSFCNRFICAVCTSNLKYILIYQFNIQQFSASAVCSMYSMYYVQNVHCVNHFISLNTKAFINCYLPICRLNILCIVSMRCRYHSHSTPEKFV